MRNALRSSIQPLEKLSAGDAQRDHEFGNGTGPRLAEVALDLGNVGPVNAGGSAQLFLAESALATSTSQVGAEDLKWVEHASKYARPPPFVPQTIVCKFVRMPQRGAASTHYGVVAIPSFELSALSSLLTCSASATIASPPAFAAPASWAAAAASIECSVPATCVRLDCSEASAALYLTGASSWPSAEPYPSMN